MPWRSAARPAKARQGRGPHLPGCGTFNEGEFMDSMKFNWTGVSALLMHSARLVDPLDSLVQQMGVITKKGARKTEADHAQLAWLEFQGGLYWDEAAGTYVPAENIHKCLIEGARASKNGKAIEAGIVLAAERVPLVWPGLETLKTQRAIYDAGYWDRRAVKVGQARVMRCRPMFRQWSICLEVLFDESTVERKHLIAAAEVAATLKGLGDYRPRYGRFTSQVVK